MGFNSAFKGLSSSPAVARIGVWIWPLNSNVEIKNEWSCTSTPSYVFMAWFLIKHRDYFILYLYLCFWISVGHRDQSVTAEEIPRACSCRSQHERACPVLACPVLSCPVLTLPKTLAFPARALSTRRCLCTSFSCHVLRELRVKNQIFRRVPQDQFQCYAHWHVSLSTDRGYLNADGGVSCLRVYSDFCQFRRFCVQHNTSEGHNRPVA